MTNEYLQPLDELLASKSLESVKVDGKQLLAIIARAKAEGAAEERERQAAEKAGGLMPDWMEYDGQADTLTIHGIKYAHELFREFGSTMPEGELFSIVSRDGGALTVVRAEADKPTAADAGGLLGPVQVRALVEENRQLAAKVNEWRDKHTASEEARRELLAAANRAMGGDTFMGEPALPQPTAEKAGDLSPSAGLSAADITKIKQYGAEVVIMQKNATIKAHQSVLADRDAEIAKLRTTAVDAKYAARYRWLRDENTNVGGVIGLGGHVLLCLHWMRSFPKSNALPGLLGVSTAAITTRDLIGQVAGTDLPVLLLGETGTGKDVAARAIHSASRRRALPLVAVNMATLNESLAAADLFGAVRGAYTGAQNAREGLFAEANGGTLFLDELGDTPASVQPMLLRVLETGSYRPLGASHDASTTARLIAATDQDLDASGFNQPLLRRMESFVIRVPALRERREDIGLLLLHFLRECVDSDEEMATFPLALISEICNYDWPGNIRQLANVTRRAVMALRAGEAPQLIHFVQAPYVSSSVLVNAMQAQEASPSGRAIVPRRKLSDLTGDDVMGAMEQNAWQISGAAQQLGISRPSLYKLIEAHPGIRAAPLIPPEEIDAALRAHQGDLCRCASQLKTPSEALRRHLRVLGLDATVD